MIQALAIGPILKAIGGFFKGISPKTWRLLLYFALVIAALLYGNHTGKATGLAKGLKERDKVQASWDDAVARGKAAIAEKDRRNAAAQATAFAKGQAIGESRVRDQQDIIEARDRTIAGLRAGSIRLQDRWAACMSGPQAGDAADLSGGPVRADELRREIAEEISEGFDADSKHARLVEFVQVQQEFMKTACGVTQ